MVWLTTTLNIESIHGWTLTTSNYQRNSKIEVDISGSSTTEIIPFSWRPNENNLPTPAINRLSIFNFLIEIYFWISISKNNRRKWRLNYAQGCFINRNIESSPWSECDKWRQSLSLDFHCVEKWLSSRGLFDITFSFLIATFSSYSTSRGS